MSNIPYPISKLTHKGVTSPRSTPCPPRGPHGGPGMEWVGLGWIPHGQVMGMCSHWIWDFRAAPRLALTGVNSRKKYPKSKCPIIDVFLLLHLFSEFCILGWICNGCSIYNAFVNCRFYRFLTSWENQPLSLGCYFWERGLSCKLYFCP